MPTSLQNRIFVATTLVAVASLGAAIHFIAGHITRESEAEISRELLEARTLAERHHATRLETLTLVARLIADLPVLKAAIDVGDPPTVEPLAEEYRQMAHADVLVVTDRAGRVLATRGTTRPNAESAAEALRGRTVVSAVVEGTRLLDEVTVPVQLGRNERLGTLGLGIALDDAFADQLKAATSSEVAIVFDGRRLAGTVALPDALMSAALSGGAVAPLRADGVEYAALAFPLPAHGSASARPSLVLLRSPTARLRFLRALRAGLVGATVLALLMAVGLSFAVARTVAQPLASLTATMREMSASGDLSRPVPPGRRWDDEDARTLAAAFGALTGSIRRFQQEAALKERLSALGRLSTVIAHEVRNPLMIIRATLSTLERAGATEAERAEAVSDIDQEVTRLDRMVKDVLEFTRPVTVERAPTDIGALCRDAAAAVEREGTVVVSVDSALTPLPTDGERLRRALVNLLTNARDAVKDRSPADGPLIEVRAAPLPSGAVIEVEDRGVGIGAEQLPHVFEPYFSTKRTGTGLGLAITRNIVESLGGTITVSSRAGVGTVMRIELPGA